MNPYIQLAKTAVENYIKEERIINPPENLPKEFLSKKSGVFITIEKQGHLRGCVGTYLPTKKNIAQEIISNAIAAAAKDYRFGPIKKEELAHLSYVVYVLNKPEPVKNIDELNPKKYGIIVKTVPLSHLRTDVLFDANVPPKSGLLLPDLEGIDTPEKQISIACKKGGINPKTETIIIYRFTTEKHYE